MQPWVVQRETVLLTCAPFLEVSSQVVELPDGRVVDDFYQIAMPDYTCILPELADGRVLLLRSYRHGPRRVCLTFPGGQVAPGEPALAAAERELLEETGHTAAAWRHLGSFVTQANQRCQTAHFFLGTGCRQIRPPDSGDLEEQELVVMSRDEASRAFAAGEFPILEHATLLALALNDVGVSRRPPTVPG